MVHLSSNIDQEACYARKAEADRAIGSAHKRPVPELASRLKLSTHETVRLLTDLEERGAVKLSPDHGIEHVRIAAITQAGRDQIAQAA